MTAQRWGEIKAVLATVLEAGPGERETILEERCRGDDGLRREVESLLALEARADAALDSVVVPGAVFRADARNSAIEPPAMIGAYRILREIGRGGMGVVYLGDRADGEYRKQVAIKLITSGRRGMLDPGMERRFRRERQILARFEHPGIARMVDGGATPEGQPYFVMEYIEGLPLLEYSEANALSTRARLELFLSVCDAVAHAHQRLVVHRDLKPGNILISTDGQAKLLDFGLARVLQPDEGPGTSDDITQAGMPILTPAYASPDQVRGAPYTVSDDVYSLGIILYELLTAKRPYHVPSDSLTEMVRVVCEQTPPPPSQVSDERLRRGLRGDLDNIVAKALEKDPQRRYATVDDMASDLRRHLSGLPVRARAATFAYRAGKFLRRHRVAVPAGAIAAILILAFAGTAWWETRRAQRRFQEVRSLAHSVMFDLHDAIAPLPGSTAARNLLLASALAYLERLSNESAGDPKLAWEVALGYERVGVVQGAASESNLGNGAGALESLKKSAAIMERLSAGSASNAIFRRDYVRILVELAGAYGHNGDAQTAARIAQNCGDLAERAYRDHPHDAAAIWDMLVAVSMQSDLLADQRKFQEMLPLRQRALDLTARLAIVNPKKADIQRDLALAHKRLGALFGVLNSYGESRSEYEQAAAIDEARCSSHPSDGRAKMDLSFDYSDLGWVSSRQGNDVAALAAHRKALAIRVEAARADPNDYRAARAVASSTGRIGGAFLRLGDLKQALATCREAVTLWTGLTERSKTDWQTVTELANAHGDLAGVYMAMGATPAAAAEFEQARSIFAGLKDKGVLPVALNSRIDEYALAAASARK